MTTTTDILLTDAIDALEDADYGAPASFELGNGQALVLTVEIDMDTSIRDYDCYGSFSDYSYSYGDRGSGRSDDMDGNAEKLQIDRGDFVWWQPPADGPKRGTPEFDTFRQMVRDIASQGYVGFILELRGPSDALGRPNALESDALWGIENIYESRPASEYGRSIIRDLLGEILPLFSPDD